VLDYPARIRTGDIGLPGIIAHGKVPFPPGDARESGGYSNELRHIADGYSCSPETIDPWCATTLG
jgi:hypothetical protein